jgi:hypothetical protein
MPTDSYRAQDYSAEAVAAGQRKINYALTVVDKRLIDVLVAIKTALKEPPGQIQQHVPRIEAAIDEASRIIDKVAEIRPPGCDTDWPTPG